MSTTRRVSDDPNDRFWFVVRRCLLESHGLSPEIARRKVSQLRKEIESMPSDSIEFFYHAEPFDVACETAHRPLPLEKSIARYLQIRDGIPERGALEQVLRRPAE